MPPGPAVAEATLQQLCEPYVEAYLQHRTPSAAPASALQHRSSVNVPLHAASTQKGPAVSSSSRALAAPPELVREYVRLCEETAATTGVRCAPPTAARVCELEAESAYYRALVLRLQTGAMPLVTGHADGAALPAPASPRPTPPRLGDSSSAASDGQRSPSATRPAAAPRRTTGWRAGPDGGSLPPATTHQVSDLQEQIDFLREAVRELSHCASVARAHSTSPAPGEAASVPVLPRRAASPSPRCATPTCTTDVPTLQRIILHQQQTIRTLQLEMEEVHAARAKMERAMTQLREAIAGRDDEVDSEDDEDDAGVLGATTHWRSTYHTEDRSFDGTPMASDVVGRAPASPAGALTATRAAAAGGAAAVTLYDDEVQDALPRSSKPERGEDAAADVMRAMDLATEAEAAAAPERRRAATFGGLRPPLWFDCSAPTPCADPIAIPGGGDEDDEDEEPSSGMRTPMPRRTVVLPQRFSSATGDNSSLGGVGVGGDESPLNRHTQLSFGTASNRRTPATGSLHVS